VAAALGEKSQLILLDNCEQLMPAVATEVAWLLQAAPQARVLATSREPLGLSAETVMRLEPLALRMDGSDEMSPAAALLRARAGAAGRPLDSDATTEEAVSRICSALDGLPLALELAAARLRTMAPAELASRLERTAPILGSGPADAPRRQETIRSTVEWSWPLLSDDERTLAARLGVFRGGWTLEAAEAVAPPTIPDVPLVLGSLVERSVVQFDPRDGGRYHFLEVVRQYALEALAASGDEAAAREAHFRWYQRLAQESDARLRSPAVQEWTDRLITELNTIRAAPEWALEERPSELGSVAGPLLFLWMFRAVPEGARWMVAALEAGPATASDRGYCLLGAGTLLGLLGRAKEAEAYLVEGAALHRELDLPDREAMCRTLAGFEMYFQGRLEEARASLEAAVAGFERANRRWEYALALSGLGGCLMEMGETEEGLFYARKSVTAAREASNVPLLGVALTNLGEGLVSIGDFEGAARAYAEAQVIARLSPNPMNRVVAHYLAALHLRLGELDQARADLQQLVEAADGLGLPEIALGAMVGGAAAAASGDSETGARLLGFGRSSLEALGYTLASMDREVYEAGLASAGEALGKENLEACLASGRGLSRAEALKLLAGLAPETAPEAAAPAGPPAGLSRREAEVLGLLGAGLSNKEIAEKLFLSVRTVESHLLNIYGKIGAVSRTEAAAYAVRRGLA
jgi:non-specific serine/threonine protein kinase